jgi:hypothetical protein
MAESSDILKQEYLYKVEALEQLKKTIITLKSFDKE